MNLYLVRHGQSLGNLEERAQTPDMPLTDLGKKQALIIAKRLKSIPLDFIYASPYLRTRETAEAISAKLKLPVEYWADLREKKRPSEIEGLHKDDPILIRINGKVNKYWKNGNWKYSDDESFEELRDRALRVRDHLFQKHKDSNILCVSHGVFIKMFVSVVLFDKNLTAKIYWDVLNHTWIKNTGITHIEYTEKYKWALLTFNDANHILSVE